ncbi:MAG TPA: hypothetical protein VEB19_16220 [Gemmatimonadaceae bacterium]|nr:hypothetical protein [Gemmatimonadaceae bacterium]
MRACHLTSMRLATVVATLAIASASPAVAQLPSASPAAFGLAGNFTAMARGYEAVAWNAANLAMPGRPFFSIGLGIAGGNAGLDPVDVKMLSEFSGKIVDNATKLEWLDKARLAGSQNGRLDGGVTPLALSVGPVGLHVGSSAYMNMALSPDAWRAYLFGNEGANGQPEPIDMTGTSLRAAGFTTGAMSFALPLPLTLTGNLVPNEHFAIGLTGKYVVGHGLIVATDLGSNIGTNDVLLRFPIVGPASDADAIAGSGTAADVSLAWSGGPFRIGLLAENVFSSFKWDTTKLAFFPGTGTFTMNGTNGTDFDEVSYNGAPAELREIVAAQAFKPRFAIGAAFNPMNSLTLTAEVKAATGGDEAIVIGPKSHFGVGAEWRLLPILPLRAGVASVTDGWQAGAGAGIRVIGFELGVSGAIRRRGEATESGVMIGVIGIGR